MITFTGWTGLSDDQPRRQAGVYLLNVLTKDLRLARLDYEMRRGEQGTTAVNDLLNRLDSGMKTPAPDRTACRYRLIDEQLAAVEQYKRAFADMAQAGEP
jgi:methyl-accepting chemotaxis protein